MFPPAHAAGLAVKAEQRVTFWAGRNLACLTAHLSCNRLQSILSSLYQLYHLPLIGEHGGGWQQWDEVPVHKSSILN